MRPQTKGVGFASSPVLAVKLPAWRSKLAVAALTVMFLALVVKAFWLQIATNDFLQKKGAQRYERVLEMPAMRGKIADRNGVVVASSTPVVDVWASPDILEQPVELRSQLARLLDMPERELAQRLDDDDRRLIRLRRQVEPEIAERIAKLGLKGVELRSEFKRSYPEGEVLAHVVGFTNVDEMGQEGVELANNTTLAGRPGSRRVIRDKFQRTIEETEVLQSRIDGQDVTLSIDSKIQSATFAALKQAVDTHRAKAGAAIVVDVATGEILALANLPTYNPNRRTGLQGAQLRNRVITDVFEPGSTLKPVTVALALDSGLVQPSTQFQTSPGRITIGTATISDSHAHGMLSVAEIIQKSSNVGTVKMAMQIEPKQMWELYTGLGFGHPPKLGFPGAAPGRVRPYGSWRPIEQATMSYGYGISVSLAQLARAYTMFARNGDVINLSMARLDAPPSSVRLIKPETAAAMRSMLEMAAGPGGTAPKAQIIGYRVAGKTGTARKQERGHYLDGKYVGSFVGFAPASAPRIIVAVMIDEPSAGKFFGGDVAAPAFASITSAALRLLSVPPDAPYKQTIVAAEGVQESL